VSNSYVWAILLALLAATAAIDVWLGLDGVPGNTFSANLRRLGRHWPFTRLVVCFGLGVVAGHLYW
jgi:hypothetical protein